MFAKKIRGSRPTTLLLLIILPSIFVPIVTLSFWEPHELGDDEPTDPWIMSALSTCIVWLIGFLVYSILH